MTNADQEYLPLLMVTQDQAEFVKGVRSPSAVYINLDERPEMASDPSCYQGHPDYRTIPIPEGIDVAVSYPCSRCEGSGHCVDYDSDDGSTLVEVPCVGTVNPADPDMLNVHVVGSAVPSGLGDNRNKEVEAVVPGSPDTVSTKPSIKLSLV